MDWPGTLNAAPAAKWPGTPMPKGAWPGTPATSLHDRAPLQADVLHDRPPLDASAEERLPFANQTYEQEARDPRRPMMNRVGAALATEGYNLANAPFQATQRLLGGIRQGEGLSSNPASVPNAPAQAGDALNAAQFGARAHPEMTVAGRARIEPFRSGDIPKAPPPQAVKPPGTVRPAVADIPKATEWPGTPNRAAEAGQAAVGKVADRVTSAPKEPTGFTELPPGTRAPERPMEGPVPGVWMKTPAKDVSSHQGYLDELRDAFGVKQNITIAPHANPAQHGSLNAKAYPKSFFPVSVEDAAAWRKDYKDFVEKGKPFDKVRLGDEPVTIGLNANASPFAAAHTIAHEFGHYLHYTKLAEAPRETQMAIRNAYLRDQRHVKPGTEGDFERLLEGGDSVTGAIHREKMAEAERSGLRVNKAGHVPYATKFNEWFADQVATFLSTDRKAVSTADKFFKGIADAWRFIYQRVTGRQGSSAEVEKFLKGLRGDAEEPVARTPEREAPEVKPEPRSVGAAASPPPAVPALPDKGMRQTAKTLSDDLHRLERKHDDVKIGVLKAVDELPPEAVKLKEKFFDYLEPGGKKPVLTKDEQAIFDKTLKPWLTKQRDLYEEIKKAVPNLLPKDYDPDYVHHLVKGRVPEFDEPLGEITREGTYPYMGAKNLPKSTRSLKASRYYAIEDAKGNRRVAMIDDKGVLHAMDGKKPTPLPGVGTVKPGESFDFDGKSWTLKRASVAEKEGATKNRYYKDAYAATLGNVTRLEKVADALHHFETMKKDPEFLQGARRPGDNRPTPRDWDGTTLPGWEGWRFEPRLREVMDDWRNKPGEGWTENLRKLNHAVLGTLFLLPFRHMGNVGAHWYVGRGWDWLNPVADARMAKDMTAALFDTLKQGPMTRQMLREGSALQYPRVANQDFYAKMLKGLGEDMKAGKYDNVFQRVGLKPKEFYDGWLKASSAAMWSFNDVLMQSRVRELARKGMSMPEAISEAEKDIPNYRINSRVVMDNQAGRAISRYLQNSLFSSFGRYNNNKWRAIADMAKDIAGKARTPKERIDGVGKFVALASLVYFIQPALTGAIHKLTGRNDKRSSPIGPAAVVDTLKKAGELMAPETMKRLGATDEQADASQLFQSMIELSPLIDQAVTQATGRNPYTGQSVQTTGERAQSIAGQANPLAVGSELASGRASPTEEILKATIGERGTPKRPPARVLSQQERQREIAEGRQPINRMISKGERALKPFTPDAIVDWLLRQGPAP